MVEKPSFAICSGSCSLSAMRAHLLFPTWTVALCRSLAARHGGALEVWVLDVDRQLMAARHVLELRQ
eukprot:4309729-Prymnesium_polylepis.1